MTPDRRAELPEHTCLHCGCADMSTWCDPEAADGQQWCYVCGNCGARGPGHCGPAEAIAAWSRRTPAPPLEGEAAAMVERLRARAVQSFAGQQVGTGIYMTAVEPLVFVMPSLLTEAAALIARQEAALREANNEPDVEQVAQAMVDTPFEMLGTLDREYWIDRATRAIAAIRAGKKP